MNITVYLGSSFGSDPACAESVATLGGYLGQQGFTLVYGGSSTGLMGILASSVKKAGGRAIGVETEFFIDDHLDMHGLDNLIVVKDMSERKKKMIELADAFIAFPGGIGTLDEITEVIVLNSLGQIRKPYILYDLNGYYSGLQDQFRYMLEEGFLSPEKYADIRFALNIEELFRFLDEIRKNS